MLLVKSKELKSSDKNTSFKTWGYVAFVTPFLTSQTAFAETDSLSNPASVVSIFLSLLLVIGVVFMLAYLARRFNVTPGQGGQMKVVASMMAGTKERVMVLQVGDEQHLIGVTAHNINHLAKLETPLAAATPAASGAQFKDKLTQALASKMNPNLTNGKEKQ
ncbi:flagellar biosynthetic protein FliO [Aestuariibacter halophilus]|uniref:Flagellar protein n=1 Tax=Fluctibacter halophilus TaxID=226011 RepID=A0ABS8G3S6_9ALTE|nr:flagellar biosynthetic protein FliO [Aestuariibacter halophilus]MCC2615154.1 flagellar biosynthetic protein FliO [Aestuariibacter halophilus]